MCSQSWHRPLLIDTDSLESLNIWKKPGACETSETSEPGTLLMVQWLGLHASTAGGMGVIPGQGTKILYALQQSQNKQTKTAATKNTWIKYWWNT